MAKEQQKTGLPVFVGQLGWLGWHHYQKLEPEFQMNVANLTKWNQRLQNKKQIIMVIDRNKQAFYDQRTFDSGTEIITYQNRQTLAVKKIKGFFGLERTIVAYLKF